MRGCVDMSSSGSFRASRRWIRWLVWAVAGGIWFLWLGYEDPGPATVVGMAAVLAAAWGLGAFLRAGAAQAGALRSRRLAARPLLIGLAAGGAGGALAALLMLIKNSIHSHPFLDFRPADLSAAIGRTPVWAGVGLLLGAAVALLAAAGEGSGRGAPPTAPGRPQGCGGGGRAP